MGGGAIASSGRGETVHTPWCSSRSISSRGSWLSSHRRGSVLASETGFILASGERSGALATWYARQAGASLQHIGEDSKNVRCPTLAQIPFDSPRSRFLDCTDLFVVNDPRMSKSLPRLWLALSFVSTSVGCAPADVDDFESLEPAGPHLRLTQEHFQDLEFIAKQRGWTLEETVLRLGWEPQFAEFVESLRQQYPMDFAGAKITPDGPHVAFIGFRDAVPVAALDDPRIRGLRVDIRAYQGYSEQQLLEQTIATHRLLREIGIADNTVAYDVETGMIDVELVPIIGDVVMRGAALDLPPELRQPNVTIKLADAMPSSDDTIWGGGRHAGCTASFMVSQGLLTGFVTAGHCNNNQMQQNWAPGSIWRTTNFMGEHQGHWGDFQWHTINGDTSSSDFHDDVNHIRAAQYLGSSVDNMTLCRLGITTNKQCDEVYRVNVSSDGIDCMVMMKNDEADAGDSGGPWFSGGTIHGVHKGSQWLFKSRDVFSQMKHVDEALNVFPVLTPPPPPPPPEDTCDPVQCNADCGGGVCAGNFCACY